MGSEAIEFQEPEVLDHLPDFFDEKGYFSQIKVEKRGRKTFLRKFTQASLERVRRDWGELNNLLAKTGHADRLVPSTFEAATLGCLCNTTTTQRKNTKGIDPGEPPM